MELAGNHAPFKRNPLGLSSETKFSRDVAILSRFGKRQQLRRAFGVLPVIGLTCTLMITWETITSTLLNGLENGGPAGLIYGYLFVWAGVILQVLVMAELASMIPLAGGPFNWVAILSPSWCRKFLSYLTGWMTMISWQALVAGTTYVSATLIQGLLELNYPNYHTQRWHATFLFYAVLAFALFINTYLGRLLPWIESMMLFFHLLGFFGILVPLVYVAPHQPAREVFTTFLNTGDWSSTGLAFFVGLIGAMTSFPGVDAADHIGKSVDWTQSHHIDKRTAEEIRNAPTVIPLAMGASTILNGSFGFGMLLAILFCMPSDIQGLLDNSSLYPFINIYTYAVGSRSGATAMTSIIIVTQIFATVGMLATCSRMLWAFAREKGLPYSKYLGKVDKHTHLPLYAIATTVVINLLLALINIGSSVGFGAFISLTVASYYSSFLLAAAVMLHKRLSTPEDDIPWGPFRLGRAGVPITILAIAYSILGTSFSMWPTEVHPTISKMNYCVFVYGGVLIFSILFWLFHGRKCYKGPVLEFD